ncbi:hypothetical protein CG716_24980 [Mycolicibacterium sphagni]|uniref:Uncharacterized protein n=1 Tax=Mycolicibacterium sphagni TaxID=1786 RepID=A0A255DJ46_9MYCO|nr:hypothetical protein CG716_24980 [Mycolicibacterium sphagni]
MKTAGKDIKESTATALDQAAATTISLAGYKGRFFAADPSSPGQRTAIDVARTPWTEFALLAYLVAEVGQNLDLDWAPAVLKQQEMLKTLEPKIRAKIEAL